MESEWAMNPVRLGFTYAGPLDWMWDVRPRLAAQSLADPAMYHLNWDRHILPDHCCVVFVADGQVYAGPLQMSKADPSANFPYGFAVVPDTPP